MRFLMYSHDGVGLGHLRRNIAIAEALTSASPESSVLLASGTTPVGQLTGSGSIDFLKLPELRKIDNAEYGPRRLAVSQRDILNLRSNLLRTAVESFKPDLILVDKHPLGAGSEMESALLGGKAHGAVAVLGLRDILDSRESVHHEWFETDLVSRVPEIYDRVLVYGQQDIFDPVAEYNFPETIAERVQYCGYVVHQENSTAASDTGFARIIRQRRERPLVLATVGGGEDGFPILKTFINAAAGAPWQGAVVAGPMMPREEMQWLQRASTDTGVFFEPFVAGLDGFISSFDAVICMGGYNTLLEAAKARVPTICVPRKFPRREQEIRACTFQRLGLVRTLFPENLYPAHMRGEIDVLIQDTRGRTLAPHHTLDTSGAEQAALELLRLAVERGDCSNDQYIRGGIRHPTCAEQVN